MNNFLYYLEEVILNYNIYYNLKKIENTDENSKNHSKIKIKLFNKIILHINKVGWCSVMEEKVKFFSKNNWILFWIYFILDDK